MSLPTQGSPPVGGVGGGPTYHSLPSKRDREGTLRALAARYETREFINGDPSWFMHQVDDAESKELLAFVASTLSYGSRKQFMPKIQHLLDCATNRGMTFHQWVAQGAFTEDIPDDGTQCLYRLYTYSTMHRTLLALKDMVSVHGTIQQYLRDASGRDTLTCMEAIELIVAYFSARGIEGIIPKNTKSSCKRICMFIRWMVRDNSPVDIGLWSGMIDKRTLIMPMDTHVVNEACRLGLLQSKTASMTSAIRLTERLKTIFPDDPLKGDFALFGVGIFQAQRHEDTK